jgi:catechol 2,3-dioxygenase-like lactoylglutathione lyase family enzyme
MAGAPLPLLGTFHEISVAVPDVRAAVEFYERLGFTQATTTDAFTHPYGVLTDGRLFIGLHQRPGPSPILTFVRPGIAASLGAFAAAGIRLTSVHVGEEVFNEIAFADPFGHTVAVLEARTYSPVARRAGQNSLCGHFAEVSLPVADFTAAQSFWEPLGFVAAEPPQAPYPHLALTSDNIDLSFHRPRVCERPMLVFRDPDMRSRIAQLRELGVPTYTAPVPADRAEGSAWLESPDGTPLLLLEEEL